MRAGRSQHTFEIDTRKDESSGWAAVGGSGRQNACEQHSINWNLEPDPREKRHTRYIGTSSRLLLFARLHLPPSSIPASQPFHPLTFPSLFFQPRHCQLSTVNCHLSDSCMITHHAGFTSWSIHSFVASVSCYFASNQRFLPSFFPPTDHGTYRPSNQPTYRIQSCATSAYYNDDNNLTFISSTHLRPATCNLLCLHIHVAPLSSSFDAQPASHSIDRLGLSSETPGAHTTSLKS